MAMWAGSLSGTEVVYQRMTNGDFKLSVLAFNGRGFSLTGLSRFSLPEEVFSSTFSGHWKNSDPSKGRIFLNQTGLPEFDASDVAMRSWSHMLWRMLVACEKEENIRQVLAVFSVRNRTESDNETLKLERDYGFRVLTVRERSEKKGEITAYMPIHFETKALKTFISKVRALA